MEGVRQYGTCFQNLGHRVEVVTLDDPHADFVKEFPLYVHALGPVLGKYGYNRNLVPWLRAHAQQYDVIVVNGLWQYHSLATWRALRKGGVRYYLYTHGMLDPWFKLKYPLKHLKKLLYWTLAEYRVLRDAKAVLFTTEEERLMARSSFRPYRATERVVGFGTAVPPANSEVLRDRFLARRTALRDRRIILFLGRIHEKKGCDLLLRAFASVLSREDSAQLVFAGPDETRWVPQLQAIARELGVDGRVSWEGMLRGDDKWGAFYSAEVFVLPSHQENFGVAVAEALGCGLPVLISDKVNIWREVQQERAGLVAPDTQLGTNQLLNQWLDLTGEQRRVMGESARRLFTERFAIDVAARNLLGVLADLGQSGALPA